MPDHEPELFFDFVQSIGHGGQADVYLVRLRKTGGLYACKILREAWDPLAREQFRREAARQRRIAGAHVVPIIAWNLDAERPFLIQEYMPRGSLAGEIARRGKLAPIEALETIRQIAVAVADLHTRGVVHRDLKPGNVLRAKDGSLKLNDLGCAATMTLSEWVRAPGFIGTPRYAAPEQMLGLASEKSDVFALGVMLHEFLLGVPGSQADLPSKLLGGAAQQLNGLIGRLCAKDPRLRPTSAAAITMIDEALGALRACELRTLDPVAVHVRAPAASAAHKDGNGWEWLLGGAALVTSIALLSRAGSTWDPYVGRYRGSDGRFRGG